MTFTSQTEGDSFAVRGQVRVDLKHGVSSSTHRSVIDCVPTFVVLPYFTTRHSTRRVSPRCGLGFRSKEGSTLEANMKSRFQYRAPQAAEAAQKQPFRNLGLRDPQQPSTHGTRVVFILRTTAPRLQFLHLHQLRYGATHRGPPH